MTFKPDRDDEAAVAHRTPPAMHLFGSAPHDPATPGTRIGHAERDHFVQHFARSFSEALQS